MTTTMPPVVEARHATREPTLNRTARRVRIVARSMMAVQITVVTWACLHAWFYSDDYMIRSQGATYAWLDPSFLLEPWGGHWMPAAFAVAQPFAKFGDFTHGAIAVSLAVGQAFVAVLLYRFLRRHFGFRWRILIPLALYLTSIPVLQASVWWAAGLQALPLLACLIIVSDHTLRLAHGRRVSSYAWIVATTIASLAFFEKSILIPVVVFYLLLATTPVAGPVRAAIRVVRLHWPLAMSLVVVDGAWLIAYRIFHTNDISASPSLLRYGDQLSAGLVGTFIPSLYGGPWDWRSVATSYNAVPTMPAVALALSALTGLIVLFVMTWGPRARRLVALVVTYALLVLALINAGRSAFLIETSSLPRYYADLAMVTVIASAVGLARLKDDPAPEMLVEWRPRLTRPRTIVLAVFVQLVLISWFVSSTALTSGVGRGPERPWVTSALASLRANTSTSPVLDRTVPAEVLWPVVFPQNLYHWFFAGVSGMPAVRRRHGRPASARRRRSARGRPYRRGGGTPRADTQLWVGCHLERDHDPVGGRSGQLQPHHLHRIPRRRSHEARDLDARGRRPNGGGHARTSRRLRRDPRWRPLGDPPHHDARGRRMRWRPPGRRSRPRSSTAGIARD